MTGAATHPFPPIFWVPFFAPPPFGADPLVGTFTVDVRLAVNFAGFIMVMTLIWLAPGRDRGGGGVWLAQWFGWCR
jgi:hypothetical protein